MIAAPVPVEVLKASPGAVKVYALIAIHQRQGERPTRRNLADGMGLYKTSAVDRYLKELVNLGVMTVIGGGGRRVNEYTLGGWAQ